MTDTTKTPTAPKASKPRKNRTPGERAQDAVDAAQGRYDRAKAASDRLKKATTETEQAFQDSIAEQSAADEALKWAQKNPDLPRRLSVDPATGGAIITGGTS